MKRTSVREIKPQNRHSATRRLLFRLETMEGGEFDGSSPPGFTNRQRRYANKITRLKRNIEKNYVAKNYVYDKIAAIFTM